MVFDTLSRLSIDTLLRGAILILVGYVLIRLILKLVRRALNRTNLDAHISHTLITACRLVLYFILLTMVMGQLGISSTSLVTLLGVFGLALSLALQDTLSNIAGGLFVLYTKPFKVGDYVELWGVEGTVQLIGFIHTTLTTIDNKLDVYKRQVSGAHRRRCDGGCIQNAHPSGGQPSGGPAPSAKG